MSHMKRLMDEHGICEAYIESQETALNTAKDKIQELEKLIEVLQAQSNYDEWGYLEDPESGIGIVINHFRDDGEPSLNVFVVPRDKVANKDWHSDMYSITEGACFCAP